LDNSETGVNSGMETSYTAIQKVDIVLKFLANNIEAKPSITDGTLFSLLTKKHPELENQEDFGSDLLRILNKLAKEGYVDFEDTVPPTIRKYYITFDGKVLNDEGGYERASNSEDVRRRWEDELLIKGEKNGERLNTLTLILGIGTIALAIIEVIKLYYELSGAGH
jgi:hypothetical protein